VKVTDCNNTLQLYKTLNFVIAFSHISTIATKILNTHDCFADNAGNDSVYANAPVVDIGGE